MNNIEKLILVDPDDNKIGEIEKNIGHQYAMLHRAFSVFIFRYQSGKLQTLLQQRNKNKYHAGGLWTNACCSHPYGNKDIKLLAEDRLSFEMGVKVKLKKAGVFHYIAQFENGMNENEIDHVFVGFYEEKDISFNPIEVQDYLWVDVIVLQQKIEKHPKRYTPWLKQALEIALTAI